LILTFSSAEAVASLSLTNLQVTHSEQVCGSALETSFPRYAITVFTVSTRLIDQQAQLLQQVGAYNVTIVYRELESDKIALLYQKLKPLGISMIPELSYMQRLPPSDRIGPIDVWLEALRTVTGRLPSGFFSFQVDTYTANYARDRYGASFAIGNIWDQVNMDFMSLRGGHALPYYASRRHSLIPAENQSESSLLVIQPFAIALTNRYHFDNNHVMDLFLNGVDVEEFKYVSSNYPFFTPFFLELDWLFKVNDPSVLRYFVEAYSWVYRTFQVITAESFTTVFRSFFEETPEYYFTYRSSNSLAFPDTAGGNVEWLMNSRVRIARIGGQVVSALRYSVQQDDLYLIGNRSIDFSRSRFGEDQDNLIDTSMRFDVDNLWQQEYGDRILTPTGNVPYLGDLHHFYGEHISSVPVDLYASAVVAVLCVVVFRLAVSFVRRQGRLSHLSDQDCTE